MTNENENDKFIEIHGVRITPSKLKLMNTYALKEVTGKFIVQNVGKHTVLIRIFPPSKKVKKVECTMEPLKEPRSLPVGLRIIRTIKFAAMGTAGNTCVVPIYINDDRYDYEIKLSSQRNKFRIMPQRMDLGTLQVGIINRPPGICIQNLIMHGYNFHVEVGKCDVVVIAEPRKGCLMGLSTVDISVKVISLHETEFMTNITVKCADRTTVIPVTGNVIFSKLEPIHMNATESFTLVNFPPTYFGLKSVQNLYVRNRCIMQKMFSTVEEPDSSNKMNGIDFKSFRIVPAEGYFEPNETKLFQFTFSPIRRPGMKNTKDDFYFCTVLIHKFQCRSLELDSSLSEFFEIEKETASISERRDTLTTYHTEIADFQEDADSVTNEGEELFYTSEKAAQLEFIRIHLYATAEDPCVEVFPDELIITDIVANTKEVRVLELRNKSENLPIIFRYKKTAFVNLKASNIYLNPKESIQISVEICPQKLGTLQSSIIFQLMYYDQPKTGRSQVLGKVVIPMKVGEVTVATTNPKPILNPGLTPNYIKEVGKSCQEVKFDTVHPKAKIITVDNTRVIDEHCGDFVAFPNDTQQSLRPWRAEVECRTIFARLPRYQPIIDTEYEKTVFDIQFRKKLRDYYSQFLRNTYLLRMPIQRVGSEYSLTDCRKAMCRDMKTKVRCADAESLMPNRAYIPLTPKQLEKIVVCPRLVDSGQVAVNDISPISITVTNGNPFPVRIFTKVDKSCVLLEKNRCVLKANQSHTIQLNYHSSVKGYHTSVIDLVINESMVLYVPVLAEVVPKMLHISSYELDFDDDNLVRYIDIKNKLGIPVDFHWLITGTNIVVKPEDGRVNARKYITCTFRYTYNIKGTVENEIMFYSGDDMHARVTLRVKDQAKNIILPESGVNFNDISLNKETLRRILIRNPHSVPLLFSIVENQFEKNIAIFPDNGILPPQSDYALYLTAKFANCVKFDGYAIINIPYGQEKLRMFGNVVYPKISVTPQILHLPKVPAGSTSDLKFVVKNHSIASASIRFDMDEFQEFRISDSICLTNDRNIDEFVIEPNCSKYLYIHFIPSFESSCVFYLPMIINDLLGPPIYTDVVSTTSRYYLTDDIERVEILETPTHLPCVKVKSLAMCPKILISKTRLVFSTYPMRRTDEQDIIISNPQSLRERIGIKMEQLKHPFYMDYPDEVEKTECGIIFNLDAEESITLKVYFTPEKLEFGEYNLVLRIFLSSDISQEPHTAICVRAVYVRPDISVHLDKPDEFYVDSTCIRYGRIYPPLNVPMRTTRIILCKNHLPDCVLRIEHNIDNYCAWIPTETKEVISENTYSIHVTAVWQPQAIATSLIPLRILCNCGGDWTQFLCRCVESSFLTSPVFCSMHFMSIALNPNVDVMINVDGKVEYSSSHPFYPTKASPEKTFLDVCITIIEKWIHTQLTFGEVHHQIPHTINDVNFNSVTEEELKRCTRMSSCNVAQILITLAGPRVCKMLELKPEDKIPEDNLGQTAYLIGVYTRALKFLKDNGASLTYIQPEYLLTFNYYTVFRKNIYAEVAPPYTLTKYITKINEFDSIAKASWLDFFLQSYKVFVVNRIYEDYQTKKADKSEVSDENLSPMTCFYMAYDHVNKYPLCFSDSESYLMSWLEYTYNSNKYEVWGRELKEKTVGLFDESLKDGIIFATVTLVHCPYLLPQLQSLYFYDHTVEESIHNASTLVRIWKMVNFSFDLDADLICNPNPLGTLMFIAYLYEVLPYMYPTETIELNIGLSQTATECVVIKNNNNFPIAYKPILISEGQCFSIEPDEVIIIPRHRSQKINVTYIAKFAKAATATLLLSGEVEGYRYAKNKCISFTGTPDLSYASTTFKLPVFLYHVIDVNFVIQSPYKTSAVYDIHLVPNNPITDPKKLFNRLYNHQLDRLRCRRIMLYSYKLEFDEEGVGELKGFLLCLGNFNVTVWVYFRNKEVGEFCVKFMTKVKDSVEREVLSVFLPETKLKRTRANKIKTIFLEVPYRNKLLLKGARSVLTRRTEGDERALWDRIVDTPMGVNILQRLMLIEMPKSVPNVFHCSSGEYEVTTSNTGGIIFPDTITFPEECSTAYLKVPLQLVNPASIPPQVLMTLECKEIRRKRVYVVRFEQTTQAFSE